MNNEEQSLYPTDKMESAIRILNDAIKSYWKGVQSQRTYEEYME
jgi:exonuclease VII small subunit